MYAIELQGVNKNYAGAAIPAIKDLTLRVSSGDIVTLLGPSGCGKTTTLRLIGGFERPDSGRVSLGGRVVSDVSTWVPPERRGIGMVFQDYALFPHLSVVDNVGFACRNMTHRVKEVLQLVGLEHLANRYPHELSGGQQQRVALARALASQPVVILFDEPFSNLDADLKAQMRVEVKQILKTAGATAVFVTHDQKDALAISDQIVVMKDGVVQQQGTPREIYQFPENEFVATFVGESNILPGVIAPDGSGVTTPLGTFSCHHTHCKKAGDIVQLSIRPESLEYDPAGLIEGRVVEYSYSGQSIDARIEVLGHESYSLIVHVHPEHQLTNGDILRFRVLPDFVAVIRD